MPLADLSIDDVIALACREVPECWALGESYGDDGSVWKDGDDFLTRLISNDEGVYQAIVLEGPILHAVWFASAWEWMHTHSGEIIKVSADDPVERWMVPDPHDDERCTLRRTGDVRDMPTKYHALAAAVLLAAGKVVP